MGFLTWHMVGQANHVFMLEGNPSVRQYWTQNLKDNYS